MHAKATYRKCDTCGSEVPVRETDPPGGFVEFDPVSIPALMAELEHLRDRLDRALSYREVMEDLPKGTLPRL